MEILTQENISEFRKNEKHIIYATAIWCGPCRMLSPIMDKVSEKYPEVNIGKMDVEQNSEVTSELGIRNIPAILFIKNGEIVDRQVGAVEQSKIEEKLNNFLNN